jgi:hypothetical protein
MRFIMTAGFVVCSAILAGGCNRMESPAKTQSDVAAARQDAAEKVAKAIDKAEGRVANAHADEAKASYDVVVAQLEGERDVVLQACESKPGEEQRKCKDQARADFESAKAGAQEVTGAR